MMDARRWSTEWTDQYANVKRGSLSGTLLRKYWHPILLSSELPPRSSRLIRLLGDEILLFRLEEGDLGVIPAHCPHRGASLAYGFIERDGIRCAYHGWKFRRDGTLMEAPFGSCSLDTGKEITLEWRGIAYECGGVIFVCLDPVKGGVPNPNWDILLTGSEEIVVQRHEVNCNWFQYQENAGDLTHTFFLHGAMMRALGIPDASGFYAPLTWYAFARKSFGLIKAWRYEGHGVGWGNLAVFPNMLRIVQEMHWRVPVDNERTLIFQVSGRNLSTVAQHKVNAIENTPLPAVSIESPPLYGEGKQFEGRRFSLSSFQGQDAAACVSPGTIVNRARERLVTSDFGVDLYRRSWQELCDMQVDPHSAYEPARDNRGLLDLRPWLGRGHITVSRPVDVSVDEKHFGWCDIFGNSDRLIPVPRGSASPGPLG
jgi:5,5'-dehydrodivanillate O-demethylase oxygenase subunit